MTRYWIKPGGRRWHIYPSPVTRVHHGTMLCGLSALIRFNDCQTFDSPPLLVCLACLGKLNERNTDARADD